jgi:hypothetical protein
MRTSTIMAVVAAAAIGSATSAVFAETLEDMSFSGMVEMKMIDKNKDGMVSKKEFLDTMAKVWDMQAAKLKGKKDMMSHDDFEKMVIMYLKAGG